MADENQKLEILMQSKNLVETSYSVNAVENRIFYHCLFNAQKEKTGELSCTIKLEEMQKLITFQNQKTVSNIKKILTVFKNTSLLFDKVEDGNEIDCDYNLIAGYEYNKTQKEFKIFFMERLYKHILSYNNYAPLNLEIMSRFSSFYSQRLYEALRMWSRTNEVKKHVFKIETLRFILGVGDKYPEYKNLNQRVLSQALKEINTLGNMEVSMKPIKEDGKTSKIEFTIFDKEPKKYFDGNVIEVKEKEQIELDWMGRPMPSPEEYVELPNDKFFSPKMRLAFIQWCYDNGTSFGREETMQKLYTESKEIFVAQKQVNKVSKINDLKYFQGIFKNKLEDDINRFAAMHRNVI